MEISVVIPVYNSERIVSELVKAICKNLSDNKYEIILVNDGSVDNSWKVISDICNDNTSVKGVLLSKNFGQDNAIMAGLNHASGDYVVIMDDDLQHNPSDILLLLHACNDGVYDVCYANYSKDKKQNIWKNFGSMINSKQAEILLNKPHDIYLSPFKIISKNIVRSILSYHGPYPYIDGLIARSTDSITQVDVFHQMRLEGESNYTIKKSFSVFLKHLTGFSVVPLRVASFIGIVVSVVGFILGLYYIAEYFFGNSPEGWTTIVALQLFIGGVILTSMGLVGEYIGRMYLLVSGTPQYVIKEVKASSIGGND